jgi:ribosomal protein S21
MLERDGLMVELRRRMYYEKPSLKRARKHKQNLIRCKLKKRRKEEEDY